jgi:D-xylonolactonase
MKAELWIRANNRLGESVIWHAASRRLLWVDLLDPALFMHDPATEKTERHTLTLPPPIGSIAATTDPRRIILAHRGGLSLLHLETLKMEFFCDPEQGRDAIIYNDIKVDRWGRLWVGTSHIKEQEPRGALWCVQSRSVWCLGDAGFPVSNGPAFSRDGKALYFNDSVGRTCFVYDVNEKDLSPRNRRVLHQFVEDEGMPDGMTVDGLGMVWCAMWGGSAIICLSSHGQVMRRISVPAYNVTALCFGGEEMRDVFITTATDGVSKEMMNRHPLTGNLFKYRVETPGLPEPLFPI